MPPDCAGESSPCVAPMQGYFPSEKCRLLAESTLNRLNKYIVHVLGEETTMRCTALSPHGKLILFNCPFCQCNGDLHFMQMRGDVLYKLRKHIGTFHAHEIGPEREKNESTRKHTPTDALPDPVSMKVVHLPSPQQVDSPVGKSCSTYSLSSPINKVNLITGKVLKKDKNGKKLLNVSYSIIYDCSTQLNLMFIHYCVS